MTEQIKLIFDAEKEKKNINSMDILHRGVLHIQEQVPEEYATSSTFSMVSDSMEAGSKIFFVRNPPKQKGEYPDF